MADIITSLSTVSAAIEPKKLIALATKELGSTAILPNYVTRIDSFTMGQSATQIMFENMAPSTGTSRTCGVKGESTGFDISVDLLSKDNVYDKYTIDNCCEVLTSRDARFVDNKAKGLGRALDNKIVALINTLAPAALPAHDLSQAGVLAAKSVLECRFADSSSLYLLMGCDVADNLLAIFNVNVDSIGAQEIFKTGKLSQILGLPIVVSNNSAMNGKAFMVSKEAIVLGMATGFGITKQHAEGYGPNGYYVEMEQCFYIGGAYVGKLGVGPTESPWILEMTV